MRTVPTRPDSPAAWVIVLIGAGPRGLSLLERLVSNVAAEGTGRLEVHVVDPYPPGGGRVWRDAQSELLRLNTTAEDLTVFVDASVHLQGPVSGGPTMFEWCRSHGGRLDDPALAAEAAALGPMDFPTRRLANAYFSFAYERTLARAPDTVRVHAHPRRAVDVSARGDRDEVVLEDGERILADAVVVATSHVDVRPAPTFAALATFAADHDLVYLPPSYGGDIDLSDVPAGSDVIVRGFGLGFVDLMILLTEGRGGTFVPTTDGLRYEPSGAEPRLLVGSRRGVPYHAKPMYRLRLPRPAATTFCTPAAIADLVRRGTTIEFRRDLWPLIGRELDWAFYRELTLGHPGRVAVSWPEFAKTFGSLDWGGAAYTRWVSEVVPDRADRLDLMALDRPLRDRTVADLDELSDLLRRHVRDDLARRADDRYSGDLAVFYAMLDILPVVGPALGSPLMHPRSLQEEFFGWFHGLFSFYASGPPHDRLEQLLALEAAGVLRFLGGDLEVEADPARPAFVARTSTVPGEIVAQAMIEATLPTFELARTDDPLLTALAARGEAVSQELRGPDGARYVTGQLEVDREHRLVQADGSSAARRFALGMHTMIKSAAFARPGSNGPMHRHNDQVARILLEQSRRHHRDGPADGPVENLSTYYGAA